MGSEREVKAALPTHIPFYSFHGERVAYNGVGCPTPGKNFLDPQEILVRVYNSTIAKEGGFSGEVVAIGDYIDSVGVNDYVFGGGQPCLQQYITIKAEDVCTKSRDLSFADASRLHAATLLYESLRNLQPETMVLILGDMTGFGAQICRERGCFVTSSEDFGCGEHNIIDNDNFLEWLETHDFIFDVVVDATGDLDIYDHCHKFTTKRAEYIAINPDSAFQALKSSFLPSMFGGGTRKITIARPAKGQKKAQLLSELARKVLSGEYEVKNPRIVSYRSVSTVHTVERYVTAVNVIEQKDITPEDPEYNLKDEYTRSKQDKGKGKVKSRSSARSGTHEHAGGTKSSSSSSSRKTVISPGSSRLASNPASPYSPKVSSRLQHSISASNLPKSAESSPTDSYFPAPAQPDFSQEVGLVTQALVTPDQMGSPKLNGGSPKLPIISRPPKRQLTDSMLDSSPFEQIELQSISNRVAPPAAASDEDDTESEEETAAPLSRHYEEPQESDASDAESDTGGRSQLLRAHKQVSNRASIRQQRLREPDNEDVSDIEIDPVDSKKALELQKAQQQIEALQRQVELLMASQKSATSPKTTSSDFMDEPLPLTEA